MGFWWKKHHHYQLCVWRLERGDLEGRGRQRKSGRGCKGKRQKERKEAFSGWQVNTAEEMRMYRDWRR